MTYCLRKKSVVQQFHFFILFTLLIIPLSIYSKTQKVIVTTEKANIYAEPNAQAYLIDTVKKGTLLTLIQQNKVKNDWYYVRYQSPRYSSPATGFIKDSQVKPLTGEKLVARTEESTVNTTFPPNLALDFSLGVQVFSERVWEIQQTLSLKKDQPKENLPSPFKAPSPLKKARPGKLNLTTVPEPTLTSLPPYTHLKHEIYWEITKIEQAQEAPPPKTKPQVISTPPPIKPPELQLLILHRPQGPPKFTLGLGYGASKGGIGGFLQFSPWKNLALHAGIGYYPTSLIYSETDWVKNPLLYSVGVKYFVPIFSQKVRPYLNLQYGGFAVEAVQIIEGIWNYDYVYRNEQKELFGPQALVGCEISLGIFGFSAAAGVSYALTDWEWLPQKVYFTFDLTLQFHLFSFH